MMHCTEVFLLLLLLNFNSIHCLMNEEEIRDEPVTFRNVRVSLISQTFKTKSVLYIQSSNNLKDFVIGTRIDTIRINHQIVPTLYENSVRDIRNVAVYDFSSNQIQGIQDGAFGNLGFVQALNLSSNLIRRIHSDVFTRIDVKFLFLPYNRIYEIEDGAFGNSDRLYYVDLSHNRLRHFDWKWFRGTPLKSINIRYNFLTNIPEDAFKFFDDLNLEESGRNMHHLLFDHNEIQTVHRTSLPQLNSLSFLDLSHNRLETVEVGTFDSIKRLDKLDLSFNSLVYLDRVLFKRTVVNYLNLKGNYLVYVSVELAPVINLDLNPLDLRVENEWHHWKRVKGNLLDSPEFTIQ